MLVLLSFALVLVATVLLVLGLLNNDGSLTLIYLSIASSIAAAVVLMTALRLNKPKVERIGAPEPLPEPELEPALATVGARASGAAEEGGDWMATEGDSWSEDDAEQGDEVEFPIADYDDLTVAQILPLLPQLYADEIPIVEERELRTKSRAEVLGRLADLRGASAPASAGAEPASAADSLASYTEPAAAGSWDDEEWFPIEDYDSLSAAQIQPLLGELDEEELAAVRDKEASLGGRRSLLDQIDRLLGAPVAAASGRKAASATRAATPARKTTPTRKASKAAPTRKATPARKAVPAKKAVPTKKAAPAAKAPARRAPATKVPARKAAPAKAPARKAAPAAKAPARKAPATKAPARKAAPAKKAPTAAKKAAPAKKAPAAAKKAAPAKKATAAKKATKKATRR